MRFVPNYCVSYHGEFYNAGCVFEIDREDVEEMSRHGTVAEDAPTVQKAVLVPAEDYVERSEDQNIKTETEETVPVSTDDHTNKTENTATENQAKTTHMRKPGRPKKTDTE